MHTDRDAAFMRRALELAWRGRGFTHPNPLVGAVVVRDDIVVGEGWHERYGGPHAEVAALRAAGEAARGATLYVSLEPCAHHGRTPPCTEALLEAGVSRLVFAASDPNPTAAGGAETLRRAGVEVRGGVLEEEARSQNAPFFRFHESGLPFMTLKLAQSLDGHIAAAPGRRTQLTGESAQAEAHRMRADHDAVLVGSGTAQIDDPLLTVRLAPCRRQPVRIVASAGAVLHPESRLVATIDEAPVWLLCGTDAPPENVAVLEERGVRIVRVPRSGEGVDLVHAREVLATLDIRALLVEAGARLAAAVLDASLADRLQLFTAPRFLGSGGVRGLQPAAASRWRTVAVQQFGDDTLTTLEPAPPAEST